MPEKIEFEKSFEALEKIVYKLENEPCTLEESIALFEAGMKHTKDCKTALENAKAKIYELCEIEANDND